MAQHKGTFQSARPTALGVRGKALWLAGLGLCALPCVLIVLIWRDVVLVAGLAPLLAIGSATVAAAATLIGIDLLLRPVSQTGQALGRLLGGVAPADLPQPQSGPAARLMTDVQRVIDELITLRAEHVDDDSSEGQGDAAAFIATLAASADTDMVLVVLRLMGLPLLPAVAADRVAPDHVTRVMAETQLRLRLHYGPGLPMGRTGPGDLAFALPLPPSEPHAMAAFGPDLQQVLTELGRPILCGDQHVTPVWLSGVATKGVGDDPAQTMDQALVALGTAALAAPVVIYDATVRDQADDLRRLEQHLRQAVRNDEFELYYQPVVDLTANRPVGAEALIRWHSPDRGFVAPGQFIAVAEATGLIDPIGLWVLREACRAAAGWDPSLRVAINLGARQFLDRNLVWHISEAIDAAGIRPGQLEIELTESVAMVDSAHTKSTFSALRDMGLRIAIDDFGTGHANMSTLRKLPFTTLKIDRDFVANVHHQPGSLAICDALIALGAGLGLSLVAEGVEKAEEVALLHHHGCALFQGYYFARPVPAPVLAATFENLWLCAPVKTASAA